jgi:acyl carrier protein
MTQNEVQELVLKIIRDIAPDEDLSNVKPDVRLRDQLDLDSMDFLDIVMELRKRHQVEVPEEDYMKLSTQPFSVESFMLSSTGTSTWWRFMIS